MPRGVMGSGSEETVMTVAEGGLLAYGENAHVLCRICCKYSQTGTLNTCHVVNALCVGDIMKEKVIWR